MTKNQGNATTNTRAARRARPAGPVRQGRPWLSLAAVLVGLAVAGCSSHSSGTDAATSSGDSQAVAFAQCMRDNGITDFPDPDASGQLTIDGIANNSSIDVNSASFQKALTACRDLQPAGFTGVKRSKTQQAGALAFARCIRDNGVPDFPDPAPDEPLIDTNKIPSANRAGGMDKLHAAMQACHDAARSAGVSR